MKPHVLIIDDDLLLLNSMADYLQDVADFEVTKFQSGVEALAHLATHRQSYTAVLLDYVLDAKLPGRDVLAHIRRDYADLPVIVMTGQDPAGGMNALAEGAYAFKRRPVDMTELIDIIRDLAEQNEIYYRVARDLREVLESDVCIVWRFEPKTRLFAIGAWAGDLDSEYQKAMSLTLDAEERYELCQQGDPVLVHALDIENHHSLVANGASRRQNEKSPPDGKLPNSRLPNSRLPDGLWSSLYYIPLIHKDRVMGLAESYSSQKVVYANEQEQRRITRYLRAFAVRSAEAIQYTDLAKRTQALQEIYQSVADTLDVDTILDQILHKALDLIGGGAGWLHLLDVERDVLVLRHPVNRDAEIQPEPETVLGEGITGLVAQKAMAYISGEVKEPTLDGRYPFPSQESASGSVVQSELAVPLRRGEKTIGTLTLKSRYRNAFSRDDMDLLLSLGAQAAVAIARDKLLQHQQGLSRLALQAVDSQALTDYIVKAACDLTGADSSLWLMSQRKDEGDRYMRIAAWRGKIRKEYARDARLSTDTSSSLNAHALTLGEPIVCKDIQSQDMRINEGKPTFQNLVEAEQMGWHGFMAVPLIGSNHERLGVLSLYSTEIGAFGESDSELMQSFANQVTVALQQQERSFALRKLVDVGHTLTGHVTHQPASLLRQVANAACTLTNADCTVIYPYDPVKKRFYQRENIGSYGVYHTLANITDKPREHGLAAIVRKQRMLVLHDRDVGNIEFPVGRSTSLPEPSSSIKEDALILIRRAKFIQREGIKAFVGISLQAGEGGDQASEHLQEVGVLYINFRAPHYFTHEELQFVQIFANHVANVIRSARLYSKERQQAQELDAVHHTALHIVAQDNLNTLLQTLVEEATHLLHAKGGKVYLKVPDEEMLELEAAYYVNPEIHPVGTRLAFGQGLVGDVIKHGRAKVINNYAKWPGRVNKLSSLFSSLVAVPLWIGNEIIGVLAVFDVVDSRHFSNDDIPILDRLAQQASLAINNARLLGQIRSQRKEQIDAVRDITNSITSPPDNLEDVLESMLDWAVSIMKEGSIGDIRILDAQNQTLTPVVARMPPNLDLLEHYRTTTVGEGITGWVAQHRQPKMSNDVSADARYLPSVTEMGSEIAIPLMRENELLGVLNIEHMDRDAFTEEDLQWADAIGGLASVAIENNRLFREVENRAVRLETLQEIATAISAAQSDINSLLRLIVVSLNSIFDDAPVAIRLYDAAKNVFEPDSVTTDNWPEGELSTPRPNGTSQHVIRTLEPLYIDDTENPQLPETLQLREMLLRHQVKSLAVLPLISKGRPIGVLYLQLLQSRQFTESDKQILRLFAEQAVVAIINAKSNEELDRQRVMRIQAVQDIARTIPIAAEQGQKEVLQSVVDAVAPIVGDAEYLVLIRLLDKETNELVLEATSMQGVVINQQLIQRVPVSVGIMGWVARNKEYRCVPDVSRESEYRRGLRNARSELAVPMLLDDEVIGVLTIEHSELDAFTELDIQMTQAFARLAVVAYENAQLYDAVAQRNDQLQALYDAGIKINGQLDDASVLRSIAENVCELLDPDITTIFPYNEETSQFQEGVRISSTKQPVPKPGMEGFASRLIQEKRPIFDYRQFMGNDQPLTIDGREAKAFMSIPLRFEKKTVGLLLLNYFEERQFTEDEKRLASLFGLQAATAINNARQYEIAQEHARQERWIELGRVAGSLAHRIGNNGGTIRLRADDLAEYLKERLPKDDYVDTTMETIIRNNQYILEMADLLFRPVKASGEPVVSVNIALMLDSALGIGSPGIPPDVMICRQYASKLPTVKANRWFIEVFVEIIANAIGAMQGSASKNLVVHTTEDERWLRIHFSDTGKGIPQREQERIFDLFTSSGKETNGQHSGFGLWWVRTFVRDMGGNVEIESQPGQGTTFTVVLRKEE